MSTTTLTRREFFGDIEDALRRDLPDDLRSFRSRATHNHLKIWYRWPRIHYEVWPNARDGHIEVGFHFEDGPSSSEAAIAYFDQHIIEIKHELGVETELERWTNSWARIYQLIDYQPLTEDITVEVTARLHGMITLLQPLFERAGGRIPLERS